MDASFGGSGGIEAPEDEEASEVGSSHLLRAVNHTCGVSRNNWVFFISLIAYFVVAVNGVTHQDLLLDSSIKLPILGTEMPLSRFFLAAPLTLFISYFGLLLQHAALADKLKKLDEDWDAVEEKLRESQRKSWANLGYRVRLNLRPETKEVPDRYQLSTYFFAQLIAGPRLSVTRAISAQFIFGLTLWFLPISTLLFMQIAYLPAHDEAIWLWHVTLLFLSLAIAFWLPNMSGSARPSLSERRMSWRKLVIWLSTLAAGLVGFCVLTIPDSFMDKLMNKTWPRKITRGEWKSDTGRSAFAPTAWLLESDGNLLTRRSSSTFSRNLIVPGMLQDFSIEAINKQIKNGLDIKPKINLRNRNLKYAILDGANLSDADFTGANLYQSSLRGTVLRNAKFECAKIGAEANTSWTQVISDWFIAKPAASSSLPKRGCSDEEVAWDQRPQSVLEKCAILASADMERADLRGAILESADVRHAKLKDADLSAAKAKEANFCLSQLSGSKFIGSDLTGATFKGSTVTAANFSMANLESADFKLTLADADILFGDEPPTFDLAVLRGADFSAAKFAAGGFFRFANFDDTYISAAQLSDSTIVLWDADRPVDTRQLNSFRPRHFDLAELGGVKTELDQVTFWKRSDELLRQIKTIDRSRWLDLTERISRIKSNSSSVAQMPAGFWNEVSDLLSTQKGEDRERRRNKLVNEMACGDISSALTRLNQLDRWVGSSIFEFSDWNSAEIDLRDVERVKAKLPEIIARYRKPSASSVRQSGKLKSEEVPNRSEILREGFFDFYKSLLSRTCGSGQVILGRFHPLIKWRAVLAFRIESCSQVAGSYKKFHRKIFSSKRWHKRPRGSLLSACSY